MQQRGDHGLQAVVVAPAGVLVQHPDKYGQGLRSPSNTHLDLFAVVSHALRVLGGEGPGPALRVESGKEAEGRRQPVGLPAVELEAVDADLGLEPIKPGLRPW